MSSCNNVSHDLVQAIAEHVNCVTRAQGPIFEHRTLPCESFDRHWAEPVDSIEHDFNLSSRQHSLANPLSFRINILHACHWKCTHSPTHRMASSRRFGDLHEYSTHQCTTMLRDIFCPTWEFDIFPMLSRQRMSIIFDCVKKTSITSQETSWRRVQYTWIHCWTFVHHFYEWMNEWMNESQRLIQDCTNAMEFNLQIISKRHSSHHASSNDWLVAKWRPVCENYVSRIYIKLQFTWQDLLQIQTCSCMTHPSIHPPVSLTL
jgi:hypothetical protein